MGGRPLIGRMISGFILPAHYQPEIEMNKKIPDDIGIGDMVPYEILIDEGKSDAEARIILAEKTEKERKDIYEVCDVQDRQLFKIGEFEEIYDPGFGKMMATGHIQRYYGNDILKRLKKEQKESLSSECTREKNHVSPGLYREMKQIIAKKTSDSEKKKKELISKAKKLENIPMERETTKRISDYQRPQEQKASVPQKSLPGDVYFLKTHRGMIRNEGYRELFKGPHLVYEWLWANIARHGWKDTEEYPIKAKYYDKGYLAYSTSISEIARQCGMSKATVHKYIQSFVEAGVVVVEHLQPQGKKRGQSVFILGEWKINPGTGKPEETYYRETIFMMPDKKIAEA